MSSRPLSLVSAGHPGRAREINHDRRSGSSGSVKCNRNANSNKKPPRNLNRGGRGAGPNANFCPFPSAGKNSQNSLMGDEPIGGLKGTRGTNLNHLLSFQAYESSTTNRSTTAKNGRSYTAPRSPKGKEDYVQSTAQFIVNQNTELEIEPFQVDPDIPVPWKYIEVIRLFGQEETECPICLHPPIAAKVGRCGHAHCSSCVLKLISVMEYPECPICQCHMKQADLRSVICAVEKRPKSNSKVQFVKMKRTKNTVVAVPQAPIAETWLNRYERVAAVSAGSLVEHVLQREEIELACQTAECEPSEVPFIDQAKHLLQLRRAAVSAAAPEEVKVTPVKVTPDCFTTENPNLQSDEVSSKDATVELDATAAVFVPANMSMDAPTEPEKDDSYYFYQTIDCGNIYLSSLNAKCLITQYGSLKDSPATISATMMEIDDYTMDQEVRRRFRYLSHLSVGEAFSLIYVDSEGLGLTPETFEKHRVQIQQRKKRLKQKDRNENKAHQLAEEYYDRELYGKFKDADISLASQEMFPVFNPASMEQALINSLLDGASPEAAIAPESAPISIQSSTGASGSWSKSVTKSSPSWPPSPLDTMTNWPAASPDSLVGSGGGSFWGEMKKSSKPSNRFDDLKVVDELGSDDDSALELCAPNCRSSRLKFAADLYSALESGVNEKKESEGVKNEKKPKKGQKKKKGRVIFST